MGYKVIPLRSDLPAYQFQVELEEVQYTLDIEWNERGSYWSMGILDENDVMLLAGVKLVSGVPLLQRFQIAGLPPGDFIVNDTTGALDNPGASDLGGRHLLMYRSSDTPEGE